MSNRPVVLAVALVSAFGSAIVACGSAPPAAPPEPPAAPLAASAPAKAAALPEASASPARPIDAVAPPAATTSATPPPLPPASSPTLALTQGKVPDAARDLAIADEKVRKCLAAAKTPAKAGSLVVKITISTTGFTLNADAKATGDVGKDVATCAKAALRDQQWGKPEGGGVAAAAGTFEAK